MKKKVLLGITIMIACLLRNKVNATKLEIETDKTDINPGEELHLKLKVAEIDIEQGINAIQGKLEYDKNIFEKITNNDFEVKNNWSTLYNDEDTEAEGKFIVMNLSEGEKEDQVITEITLKVKEDTNIKKTNVKISEICTASEEEIINIENVETSVKVKFSIKNVFITLREKIRNLFNIK